MDNAYETGRAEFDFLHDRGAVAFDSSTDLDPVDRSYLYQVNTPYDQDMLTWRDFL